MLAGSVHAAVIGQQLSAIATSSNNYPNFNGGTGLVLPDMNGTLKAFDLYASLSKCDPGPNACNQTVNALYVEFDGNTSEIFPAAANGIPLDASPIRFPVPALIHFTLDIHTLLDGYPTFTPGSVHHLQLGTSPGAGVNGGTVSTFTDGSNNIYFVGYNTIGTPPSIRDVSIHSHNASTTLARAGDVVVVDFTADTPDMPLRTPVVTIGAHSGSGVSIATTSSSASSASFEASTTLTSSDPDGPIAFTITTANRFGDDSAQVSTTSDASAAAIDNTKPFITADSRTTNEHAPLIGGMATDTPLGLAGVTVMVGAGTYTAVLAGDAWSVTLPDLAEGSWPISATATDLAGNQSQASAALVIDRTAPAVAITGGPANGSLTNLTSATFTFTSDTPTFCSIDGGTLEPCTSPLTFSGLSAGTHLFSVSASDEAGNTTAQTRSWSVDTAAPLLTEVAIATSTSDTTPSYVFSSSKAGTIIYGGACTSTTTAAVAGDNTITFNQLAPGTYSGCTIMVIDAAGNSSAPLVVSTFTISAAVPPSHPKDKDECKEGGWRTFTSPSYKNQGDCVSDVVSHKYKDKDN
jgi:hypothetical protein